MLEEYIDYLGYDYKKSGYCIGEILILSMPMSMFTKVINN